MGEEPRFVGIDVSKARLDVAVRPAGKSWGLPNDETGIDGLVPQLVDLGPTLVLLEATGGLEVPLVAALAAAELPVVVVNPRQVRDFAKATGTLAKTDALDAGVLAHFADVVRPDVRPLSGRRCRSGCTPGTWRCTTRTTWWNGWRGCGASGRPAWTTATSSAPWYASPGPSPATGSGSRCFPA